MFDVFHQSPFLTWIEPFLKEYSEADVYVVGGALRDTLRGRSSKDVDLVVTGLETELLETWLEKHGTVSFVGKRFGVWKFSPHHDPSNPTIDIALPRKEVSTGTQGGYRQFLIESDPHLPIEEDLARRDFTINAMAYRWRTRELIDPFGGQDDLASQTIRTVGDPVERFQEDSSRLLRALRFACSLRFSIESGTWQALVQLVSRLSLKQDGHRVVARELMAEEFIKTLKANPERCLELYTSASVWRTFGIETNPTNQLKEFFEQTRTLSFKEKFGDPSTELLLSLLCFHLFPNPSEAHTWLQTWRLGMQANLKAVMSAVRLVHTDAEKPSLAQIEQQLLPHQDLLLPFIYILIQASAHQKAEHWLAKLLQAKKSTHLPFLMNGEDLREQGLSEGPRLGEILDQIRTTQLKGGITTKKEALELLQTLRER